MRQYNTYAETEALLLTALDMKGRSIREISEATYIASSTLYKWKSSNVHLSPQKQDRLLLYFMNEEPQRLELAQDYQDGNVF